MAVDGVTKQPTPALESKKNSDATEPANGSVSTRLAADKAKKSAAETDVIQVSSLDSEKDVIGAVRQRETDFLAQVNEASGKLNEAKDITKAALTNDRKLAKLANKLEELDADGKGDKPKAQEIKNETGGLLEERSQIADRAKEFNSSPRAQEVNFGSRSQVVKLDQIKVTEISAEKLGTNSGEIAAKLKQLTSQDRELQRSQRQDLREVRNDLTDAVGGVRAQVEGITGAALKSFDEAKALTSKIDEGIRAGGLPRLEESLAGQAVKLTKTELTKLFAGQLF